VSGYPAYLKLEVFPQTYRTPYRSLQGHLLTLVRSQA